MKKINKKLYAALTVVAICIILTTTAVFYYVSSVASTREVESYMACGCGGCGGVEPQIKRYSKAFGEEKQYREAIAANEQTKQSSMCTVAGCSMCTKLILVE